MLGRAGTMPLGCHSGAFTQNLSSSATRPLKWTVSMLNSCRQGGRTWENKMEILESEEEAEMNLS